MAYRLTNEKAYAIASEYCTNGFIKTKALLSVGYAETYATRPGLKLFEHSKVLQAIAKIQAVAVARTGYTIEQCQAEYEELRVAAKLVKQYPAAVSAVTGKARLHGFDKNADANSEQTRELSEAEQVEADRFLAWKREQDVQVVQGDSKAQA